jgi:DNA-binding CsgD family transcriptional regulator
VNCTGSRSTRTTFASGRSSTNSSYGSRQPRRLGGRSYSSAIEGTSPSATGSCSIYFARTSCGCISQRGDVDWPRRSLRESTRAGLDWIVLGPGNEIEFATERARSLLGAFLGDSVGSRVPEPVEAWMRREATRLATGEMPTERVEPLTVEREGRRLVIRWTGRLLLLTEPNSPTSEIDDRLTPREREVLGLVRVGMSNAEIAAALSLANGTVRRHLQNVYAKLGVGSRTAAIARHSGGSALPAADQELCANGR